MQKKIIYKTDLLRLNELKEKTLVAIIPDEDNPHAVFYIPATKSIRVEDKTGSPYLSRYCYSNVRERIEKVIKELSETDEEYFCDNPDCDEFEAIMDPENELDTITEKDMERISGLLYNALCSICDIFGLSVDDYVELEPEEKSWAELMGDYYG